MSNSAALVSRLPGRHRFSLVQETRPLLVKMFRLQTYFTFGHTLRCLVETWVSSAPLLSKDSREIDFTFIIEEQIAMRYFFRSELHGNVLHYAIKDKKMFSILVSQCVEYS